MEPVTISVSFPDVPRGEGNSLAEALLSEVKSNAELRPELDVLETKVTRTDPQAQDFGASLVLVLGTPAIIILAKTLRSWVERTGRSSLVINGVRVDNLRSQDVAAVAQVLMQNAKLAANPVMISVSFPDIPRGEGNSLAEALLSEVKSNAELRPELDVLKTKVTRTDPQAQDSGASLVLVLGTPAIILLAKTLKSWVERTGRSSLVINGARVDNLRSQDVAAVAEALMQNAKPAVE